MILENIDLKDEDKLTSEERELKEDLQELKRINSDFEKFCEILKDRAISIQKELRKQARSNCSSMHALKEPTLFLSTS